MEFISSLILFLLAASWTTNRLGVHALFGAFMAGLIMPTNNERMIKEVVERIESLSLALLLPLFFALTGLRTRIDLLTDKSMWGYHCAYCYNRSVGKTRRGGFTARTTGMTWKDIAWIGSSYEHPRAG